MALLMRRGGWNLLEGLASSVIGLLMCRDLMRRQATHVNLPAGGAAKREIKVALSTDKGIDKVISMVTDLETDKASGTATGRGPLTGMWIGMIGSHQIDLHWIHMNLIDMLVGMGADRPVHVNMTMHPDMLKDLRCAQHQQL